MVSMGRAIARQAPAGFGVKDGVGVMRPGWRRRGGCLLRSLGQLQETQAHFAVHDHRLVGMGFV